MSNVVAIPQANDLNKFIDFLYEGLEGYAYIAVMEPKNPDTWEQAFFDFPTQKDFMIKAINKFSPTHEVYIAPAIYRNKKAEKEDVKATNVIWLDLDGNAPDEFDVPPSLVVQSSEPGHAHAYWKLDQPLGNPATIEDYNRRLCFKYGADLSGWDATQVLRPPFTINHKRQGASVAILWDKSDPTLTFNTSVFDDLAPAPEKSVDYTLWTKLDLPSLNDVIYQNKFGPDFKKIFEKAKAEVDDRSVTLTNLAFICAEAGLSDKEIYVIIDSAATRWDKFNHHTPSSKAKQLISIIEHTRIKYPHSNYGDLDQVFAYSPLSLLNTDIQVEWAIPGMLMNQGSMLFSGPGGIGKTQISMQFMAHIAMGVPFLGYELTEPKKVGFFSLEMSDIEVKAFLETMYPKWAELYPDKIDLLNENMTILPFGEQLALNTTMGQNVMIQYLEDYNWEGVFVDSVGSAVLGSLNDAANVQHLLTFNEKVRKKYKCFMWYVHHFRKPAPGQTPVGDAADNYGDVYLFNRATSNYTVTEMKSGLLKIKNPKQRLAPKQADFKISRDSGLMFSHRGLVNEETPDGLVSKMIEKSYEVIDDPSPFKPKE